MKILSTVITTLAFGITAANAFTIEEFKFDQGDYAVILNGEFTPGTARSFTNRVEKMIAEGKSVSGVFLNSPGGLIEEGVMVSNAVRNYNLSSFVLPNEYCASACFLALAAGKSKVVDIRARIGVHSAVNGLGQVTEHSRDATRTMARVSAKYGVSPDIIERMETTPSNQMAWLTADELKGMGVRVNDFVAATDKGSGNDSTAKISSNQKNTEWDRYVQWAYKVSANQFKGKPYLVDNCSSDHCEQHLIYLDKRNRITVIISATELDKKTVAYRYVCRTTNEDGSKRSCTDWDTGEIYNQHHDNHTKTWEAG